MWVRIRSAGPAGFGGPSPANNKPTEMAPGVTITSATMASMPYGLATKGREHAGPDHTADDQCRCAGHLGGVWCGTAPARWDRAGPRRSTKLRRQFGPSRSPPVGRSRYRPDSGCPAVPMCGDCHAYPRVATSSALIDVQAVLRLIEYEAVGAREDGVTGFRCHR